MLLNPSKLMLLLGSLALLSGCGKTQWYVVNANDLCESWQHQTLEEQDHLTDKSAAIAEGNNHSRPHWGCEYGANRAKQ